MTHNNFKNLDSNLTTFSVCKLLLPSLFSLVSLSFSSFAFSQETIVTVDRYIPHVSTTAALSGERVGIFVREKLSQTTHENLSSGTQQAKVVLMVHGGSISAIPDFDLPFKDYSWMAALAEEGFDVFALDQTGYGMSARPFMDNPCNLSESDQSLIIPLVLTETCSADFSGPLSSYKSDVDEINAVVEYIKALRHVERVHLLGWSAGGRRVAEYASTYPEKVEKVMLFAPYNKPGNDQSVSPDPIYPMRFQTRSDLIQGRWLSNVSCQNQVDPEIEDNVWQTIMANDALGYAWNEETGIMRVRTVSENWDRKDTLGIQAPTLIMVGQQDGLFQIGRALYEDLNATDQKVFVEMECATHFALWEAAQYKSLHNASIEWFETGRYKNMRSGETSISPLPQ